MSLVSTRHALSNGRVLTPGGIVENQVLLTAGGRIEALVAPEDAPLPAALGRISPGLLG